MLATAGPRPLILKPSISRIWPIISGALACIECSIQSVIEAGDHWFVLGSVTSLDVRRNGDPMLFYRGCYGGFAEIA